MAKKQNEETAVAVQEDNLAIYQPSQKDTERLMTTLDNTEFEVELGTSMLKFKPGDKILAVVCGMTKVPPFGKWDAEATEDAIALLVKDEAAPGGGIMKSSANEVIVKNLREYAEKAQSGGDLTPVSIECLEKREGKNGSYFDFKIRLTKQTVQAGKN